MGANKRETPLSTLTESAVHCNLLQCSQFGVRFKAQALFPYHPALFSIMSLILIMSQVGGMGVQGWLVRTVQPWRQCIILVYIGAAVFVCFFS